MVVHRWLYLFATACVAIAPAEAQNVAIVASSNPVFFGQGLTLTATVSPAPIRGSVSFFDGVTLLGTRTLANGQASFRTAQLIAGTHSLHAAFGAATSAALVETVIGLPQNGFGPLVSYAAGLSVRDLAVADFNGDGNLDLAIPDTSAQSVNVLLGNGDGTFQPPKSFFTGHPAATLSVADLDGDGNPDVVVLNENDTVVTVLMGDGAGGFQSPTELPIARSFLSVAIADFNLDGCPDLALLAANGYVNVLPGLCDGTFQNPRISPVGDFPVSLAPGDFNHDGLADLAVANSLPFGTVSVLLGTGDGSFRAPVTYAAGGFPSILLTADIDGDGNTDLIASNSATSNVSVLLGNRDGTFNGATNYPAGTNPGSIAVGDFDGDSRLDLAVANASQANVSVLGGAGNGAFQPATNYLTPGRSLAVVAADFNGDYRVDLAVADGAAVSVFPGIVIYRNQTITIQPVSGLTLGAGGVPLGATASSGLPVSLASSTPQTCVVSGGSVSPVNVGVCSIIATQGGNPMFAAASPVAVSFPVKLAQVITFNAPPSLPFLSPPFQLSATATSGLPVAYVSNTPPVCTVSGSTVTIVAAGTCSVTANQAGDATYTPASPQTQSFTVTPASQSISLSTLDSVAFISPPLSVSATASSGLPVTIVSNTPGVCTVTGVRITIAGAGACSITASQSGNGNYTAAAPVTKTFTVNPASQTITFPALLGSVAYLSPSLALAVTASSGLPVTLASNTPQVCGVGNSNAVAIFTAGLCSITASQNGNANFAAATPVTQIFPVLAASQTITFSTPASITPPIAPFSVSASASSGLPVLLTSGTPDVCTVAGSVVTITGAGPCSLTASQSGNQSYSPALAVTRTFTVDQETLLAPHFAAGGTYTSVICALNAANRPARFSQAFRDDNGKPASLAIDGSGSVTSVSTTVPARGMACYDAENSNSSTLSGSTLATADPGVTVQALFRNASGDGHYYEASVSSGPGASEQVMPFDATTFAPTGAPIYTGVAIANMDGSRAANVTCTARDADGNVIPGAVSIPLLSPGGHWAGYQFPALTGLRGTLDCVSNTKIGMIGLRFLGAGAFSSLPVTGPGTDAGSSLPHFAAGGGWVSGFFVMNTAATQGHFAIAFRNDHGLPVSLQVAGAGNVNGISGIVPAHGLRYYEASSPDGQTIGGSGVLTLDSGVVVQALFRNRVADGTYYEAAAPASSGSYEFTIPFDGSTFAPTGDTTLTGLAIANMDTAQAAKVICTARDESGNVIPGALPPLTIDAGGHWADYRFPALNGRKGTIDCASGSRISAIGLRFLGTNAFSSLPVVLE